MTITGFSWSDAIKSVKSAREIIEPNYGFKKQLAVYEITSLLEVDFF